MVADEQSNAIEGDVRREGEMRQRELRDQVERERGDVVT